jgi:hypothetical protein
MILPTKIQRLADIDGTELLMAILHPYNKALLTT